MNPKLVLKNTLKALILFFVIRPFVWYFLGLNRYSRLRVPGKGACILAPNHNSHLDTVLLQGLLPLSVALRTSYVAAGDYFYDIPGVSWLLFDLFDFVPVWRRKRGEAQNHSCAVVRPDPIESMSRVLRDGRVLTLFPEGTRGLPEQRTELRRGIAQLALKFPDVPIVPIYMRGLGKSLPKGEKIFIPLIPQVVMGDLITGAGKSEESIMEELARSFEVLEHKTSGQDWIQI